MALVRVLRSRGAAAFPSLFHHLYRRLACENKKAHIVVTIFQVTAIPPEFPARGFNGLILRFPGRAFLHRRLADTPQKLEASSRGADHTGPFTVRSSVDFVNRAAKASTAHPVPTFVTTRTPL